jgi:HSP20 family protein
MATTATKLPVRNETKAVGTAPKMPEWSMFADLRREMDRLFDDFGRGWFRDLAPPAFDTGAFGREVLVPAVDVVEKEGAWTITAELPGLDDKAVDVSIAGDILTLKGEKTETREEDDKGTHVSERRYGSFTRSFRLPDGVDRETITADFAKGILTVTLPKRAVAKEEEKKIEVKAA